MYVLRRCWLNLPLMSLVGMLVASPGAIAQTPLPIEIISQADRPWIDVPPPLDVPDVPPPSREREAAIRYLVYVNSRRSELLQQIQRLNPEAGFGRFRGAQIIQAGLFDQREAAERRSRQLAARGISSQVAAVTVRDQSSSDLNNTRNGVYYVVIPGSERDLDEAMATVQATVGSQTQIRRRDRPRGLHLAIGPFQERQTAERLGDRLRRRGLSQTRVHYDPQ